MMRPLIALVALCAPAPAATLTLRLLDPHGLPVAGAAVEIRGRDRTARLETDEAGAATVQAELPVEVRASAAGFEMAVRKIEAPPQGDVVLRLTPAAVHTTLDVVVRDETAGMGPSVGGALEIDRSGARTVFDAVEKLVPGAFVTRRGVMGYGIATNGTGTVSIRGVGEQPNTGVLVVVDGRPDFQGLMGHPLPDFYSLSDVESVTVTQGPASVLYGSNAMGGVIEVRPSHPREGVTTRLSTAFGSYLTGQHRLAHGAKFPRGFYSLAGGLAHTRGERDSAAFRSQDGSATLGYDISRVWRASLEGRYGHFHVEDPGPLQVPLSNSYARVGRGGFTLNLDNATARNWGYMRVFSSYGHHIISDGFRSVDNTTGARLHQFVSLGPRLVLDGGSDVVLYGGRARNYGEHRIGSAAGFTRLEWTPRSPLKFNTGVRYDHNTVHGAVTVPEFGATCRLSEKLAAGLAIARGFRNPTIRELYLFPAPNPLLRPEYVWNYQATFQFVPTPRFRALLSAYYADLSNLIVTTGRFPNLKLDNSGRALNRGWEGTLRWRPLRRLGFDSGYAYLRSTNLAPYIPRHKVNYALQLDAGRMYVHFGGSTIGRRWADAARRSQLAGYTTATLKLSVPFKRRYTASAMVDNLFNRRYEVMPGYPMPGVNGLVGFNLQF
jgi:iron complex outermembrane receptor protein